MFVSLLWVSSMVKDSGIPFMLDERFEEDTLFLIFEEDFRFEPEGSSLMARPESHQQMYAERRIQIEHRDVGRFGISDRPASETHMIPKRPTSKAFEEDVLPTYVKDILRYATCAARHQMGDLIWWSWNAAQPGEEARVPSRLQYGTQFVSYTKKAASALEAAMNSGQLEKGHWDLVLKRFLYQNRGAIEYSYFYPPMGHWHEHASDCDKRKYDSGRPTSWDKKWVCVGTRSSMDPQKRHKYFCTFTSKGNTEWGAFAEKAVDQSDFNWKSFRGRETPDDTSRSCALPSGESESGQSPFSTAVPGYSGSDMNYEDTGALVEYGGGASSSGPREPRPEDTKTYKRQLRQIKSARARRVFVEDESQAFVVSQGGSGFFVPSFESLGVLR